LFLQRTQARQVEVVYREFRKRYPTPSALIRADSNEVSLLIRKLGLHSRLGLLRDIATIAVEHGGVLPEDKHQLMKLKGVGAYTAAAWLSLHRGKRAVLIDSNVVRWLSRMTGNPYNRDPRGVSWVTDLSESLTPCRAFQDYNYAVLDFTMKVCTPRNPDCGHCPIRTHCLYGSGTTLEPTLPDSWE
jgi:A/G-specific adenine glycosylase